MVAGKLLAGERGGGVDPWFRNVRVRHRDKAHGVQRVISRAWMCDPVAKQIADRLVLDKGAIAQRIRFPAVFKARFKNYIQELTGNQRNRIKDLASAKHRFSSHAAPFGRAALYFVPLSTLS